MPYLGAGVDQRILNSGDPREVEARIRAIFQNRGVPLNLNLDGTLVSEEARIMRLVHQILNGDLSFQGLRASVDRIATAQRQRSGEGTDDRLMQDRDPAQIRARIEAIFNNRGVDFGLNLDGTMVDPSGRIQRLVDQVLSGAVTLDQLRSSVDQIAAAHPHGPPSSGETPEELEERRRQEVADQRRAAEQGAAALTDNLAMFFSLADAASLAEFATQMIIDGAGGTEIMQALRQHELYKARFVGMQARVDAGYAPITEAQYVQLEGAYQRILHNAGVPQGFYDTREDWAQLIASDVSPHELSQRMEQGYVAALQADPAVRRALSQFYGVQEGHLAAFFIDPDRAWSSIEHKLRSAQVAGAAGLTGFDPLSREQAEGVASLGVSEQQARAGFSQLQFEHQLMNPIVGENAAADTIDQDEQIAMQFAQDATVRRRLERQRERRLAAFQGGGGALANIEGHIGLGSSNV